MDDERTERPRDERRLAREIALSTLYEVDLAGHRPGEVLDQRLADEAPPARAGRRARELVAGVTQHQPDLDARIAAAAPNWPLEQMPAIEKVILRVALFEILFDNRRVPLRAAISEAVELAKEFGSESSPRFVNGVLSTIAASAAEPAQREDDGRGEPGGGDPSNAAERAR